MPLSPLKMSLAACFTAVLLSAGAASNETPLQVIVPDGSTAGALAGRSCALRGDLVVLGEPGFDTGTEFDQGRALIYRYDGSTWVEEAALAPPPGDSEEEFGLAVALTPDGRTLAVGAPDQSAGGAVFVYDHGPGGWNLVQTVQPADLDTGDRFGEAVALSDEVLLVGAPYADTQFAFERGAAYTFRRDGGGTFVEESLLLASDGGPADLYGSAVAIDGDTLIVGAWNDNFSGTGIRIGSAYISRFDGAAWTEIKRFKPNQISSVAGEFGWSVDISGERVIVGAPEDDAFDMDKRGSAFVFREQGDDWPLEQELFAQGGGPGHQLGRSVAIDGDVAVVGAFGAPFPIVGGAGHAYRFDGVQWNETDVLSNPAGNEGDGLGSSAALEGDLVLFGAYGLDSPSGFNQGGGLVFDLLDTPWAWLGRGLAGVDGTPVFSPAGELTAGTTYEWSIEHAAPPSAVTLVIGLSELGASLKGGVLVPTPDILVPGLTTDTHGELLIGGTWPAGLPSGASLLFQAWIADAAGPVGFSATHGVSATLP